MTEQQALFKYCLQLGDDALIHSYRLSEWCSNAPLLEEDLALTNFALDLIGRAQALLGYAGKIEGKGRTEDDLAYKRGERQFYNRLLTEQPNGDFACTMARLLYMSIYEYHFYSQLQNSADVTLAAIAAKTLKEVKYHRAHATDWVIRLGDGTEESNSRMQAAVNGLWAHTGELFEMTEASKMLEESNIAPNTTHLKTKGMEEIHQVLTEAKLVMPEGKYIQTGSDKGIHSEHLGHILSEMQYLQRAYPDAAW